MRILATALALAAGTALASAQAPTFSSRVSVVRIDALAVDHGRPLADLTADDFEVLDNGVPQQVTAMFGEHAPLDVLFVFDRSNSVRGETLARLKEASGAVLEQLTPEDRAGVLAFDQSFVLADALTGDLARVGRTIDAIEAGGSTSLVDAAYAALTIAEGNSRRTMILLFTDGVDTLSWLSERQALDAARESDAVVYAVAFTPPRAGLEFDNRLIKELSAATGGRLLSANRSDRLAASFVELLQEMRSRYLLTYAPAGGDTPGWHALTVRLKKRSGRVTARRGYFVPPQGRK